MSELLRKEWRDNRWNIIGLVILAPVASLALKFLLLGGGEFDENASAGGLIPAMVLLFVLAVGADLVAADTASGRAGFLAALPVHPRTLWGAKALFLFGGASVYLVYLLLMETVLLSADGVNGLRVFVPGLTRYAFLYVGVAIVAAATLFYSTLIDRGFAVAIAAIGTIAALTALAWHLHPAPKSAGREIVATTGVWLFLAFLAGSLFAYTHGRIHLGSRLRRLGLAAAALVLLFVAPVGISVARATAWMRLHPTDPDLQVISVVTCENAGRWTLVTSSRESEGPYGLARNYLLVAIDTERGTTRTIVQFEEHFEPECIGFTGPDRLTWIEVHRGRSGPRLEATRVEMDLETGETISRRAPTPEECKAFERSPLDPTTSLPTGEGWPQVQLNRGERYTGVSNDWGAVIRKKTRRQLREWVLDRSTGQRIAVPPVKHYRGLVLLPDSPEGAGFALTKDGVVRLPLDGSPSEVVLRSALPTVRATAPDRSHCFVVKNGNIHLLRAAGSRVIRLPDAPPHPWCPSVRWEEEGPRFLVRGRAWYWLGDASDDEPKLRQTKIPADAGWPARFDDDRILMVNGGLTAWTLDGHSRPLLPAKEIP